MPMNSLTGLPYLPAKAFNADDIFNAMETYETSTVVQVIIAVPNNFKSESFFLGMYSCTNKFKAVDVTTRINYIKKELEARGINMLTFGCDGDTRFISSQKHLLEFGSINEFVGYKFAGNIHSQYTFTQDPWHVAKKLKNQLLNPGNNFKIGEYDANMGFLQILAKKFKYEHHLLSKTDLDVRESMNYK